MLLHCRYNVQPVKQSGIWVIHFVVMCIALQCALVPPVG